MDHKGKRKAKKIGAKRAAQRVKAKIEREIALDDFGLADANIPTLGDYAETWMTFIRTRRPPATAARYQGYLDLHILPVIGNKRLDEMTRQDVKTVIATAEQKGLSRASIQGIVGTLGGCLNAAIEDAIIVINPAKNPGKLLALGRPKAGADWLKPDEVGLMLDTARARYPGQYEVLSVLVFTGMRLGEALGLGWGDIDMQGQSIRVRRSRSIWGTHLPKTGRERVVDIGSDLVSTLRKLYAARAEQTLASGRGTVPETLFLNQEGEPISATYVRTSFARILERAGLRRIRLHDLRHSYASNLLAAGAPIQFVSRQLGHASIKLTIDVYGHLVPGGHTDVLNQYHNAVLARESATQPQPTRVRTPA